ncbi:hypothetical protein [Fusobacterium gonidiaformans]|uniref:hypothetical protein n=1 Tax=Fusobacterium gonidiaformans TaxID=849 RepID=UPI0001BC65DF|nr:hypothetical protein [Fusobacterium gonidiaformans]AVQ16331.1 hypothetical protein C4N16_01760 [Fusobacterium gonidiaformans ATCC 25563]EFS28900.1 hypothetical protein FGAG_01221 [Fusobacterium gonidiaformans ATCC 25563]
MNEAIKEEIMNFLKELELNKKLSTPSLEKERVVFCLLAKLEQKLEKHLFIELEDSIIEAFTSIKEDYFTFGSLSEAK